MKINIQTIEDVKHYAKKLTAEGLSFHPDDDFNDYVNFTNNTLFYNSEEAELRNKLMNDCFDVCEKEGSDIYEIMMEEQSQESGLDISKPIPSK